MTSENNAGISNEVYNNGNLIVHSSQEKQQITWFVVISLTYS